jgi:predicted CxxxxCH...CXXCH cytochrome family protein
MSTRSRIAIENQDGTVTSIYCHHDGYTSGVGKMLEKWYTTQAKVEALIELGNISSLDMTPMSTVAYARDRGEDLVQSKYNRVEALFDMGFNSGIEYIYCYTKSGQWLVSDDGPVMELERALEEGL